MQWADSGAHLSKKMLLGFFSLVSVAVAHPYTWKFENNPTQCKSLRVTIEGDLGSPFYRLLLVPGFGAWPTKYQDRKAAPQVFNFPTVGNESRTLEFQLRYPAGAQIVAAVGDANGFATGGTSMPWTVRDSSDASCVDNTWTAVDKWPWFYLSTQQSVYSCEMTEISWNWPNPNITGNVHFTALYPGGQSFNISTSPQGSVSSLDGESRQGFNWTIPFHQDAQFILVSGDDGSIQAPGGMVGYTVKPPQDASKANCPLNMPTRTPGVPAGGDPDVDLDKVHQQSKNKAAIAGGSVAGLFVLIGIILGVWFFLRKSKIRKPKRTGPRPLVDEDDLSYIVNTGPIDPFPSLSPSSPPFSSSLSSSGGGYSEMSFTQPLLHKSSLPGQMRRPSSQVQYVRHRDSEDGFRLPQVVTQTVELPPDYNTGRPLPSSSSSGLISSASAPVHYGGYKP
ncbi:hypothetical protein DL96DRAFT_266605 [Flagelloscypha sp. PMI_526]|nr:hypothetical protein DL96DRAFT_266605 [Flagelloscypha sp. PMI_526]